MKQQYKFYRSSKKRSDRIVQTLSIEMNSYLTKLIKSIKSHGMERNESNQIKSNQIKSNQTQEKTTQHGFDFYEKHMKSIPFYLSTILYFDFDWTFS